MKRLALGLLAFATLVTIALGARAESGSGDASKVDPFYGAFTTSVPIAVPKFHGLEPGLSLSYSSTSGNGWLGVGWTLSGFSTIERASPGKGAPAYAASDVFLLDGQVLVPCASGSTSPSCTTGGTHSTEIENYQRIAFNGAANTWTLTQKDGTRATYSPVYGVAQGTFRWGVTSVADTHGNTVSYGWWCDPGADCYPSTVSYNGTVVTLYREARPDAITFANGSYIGRTSYRIKTVDVQVSGARARSYKLTYSTSGSTSQSVLASVQQFGKDATLDATETVTGGTALPAMTTQSTGPTPGAFSSNTSAYAVPGGWWFNVDTSTTGMRLVDLNGDGLLDLLFSQYASNGWWGNGGFNAAYLNTGTGWSADVPAYHVPGGWWFNINGEDTGLQLTDLNGDGLPDLLFSQYASNGWWGNGGWNAAYLNTGSGWSADVPAYHVPGGWWLNINGSSTGLQLSDLNGDGLPDLLFSQYASNGWWGNGGWNAAYLNTGSGWSADAPAYHVPGGWWLNINGSPTGLQLNDLNGDGKPDLIFSQYASNGWWGNGGWNAAYLNTGSGWSADVPAYHVPGGWWLNINGSPTGLQLNDLNGDGKLDLIFSQYASNGWWGNGGWNAAYLNTGGGWTADVPAYHVPGGWWLNINGSPTGLQLSDLNGDGRPDLIFSQYASNGWWGNGGWNAAYLNTGGGWTGDIPSYHVPDGWWLNINGSSTGLRLADLNGDGLPDLLFSQYASAATGWWGTGGWERAYLNTGAPPDLVGALANGLGGSTVVSYGDSPVRGLGSIGMSGTFEPVESSSRLREASSTTTSDGRGASSTTSYSYQGGLWSSTERRFLGFRKVTSVIDAAGDYAETYYHQGVGCISKPDATYFRDAVGNIYSYSSYGYTENGAAPYTSLLTSRWDYECNETSTCRQLLTQLAYDTYGDATTVYEYGDYNAAGDERTTVRGYQPNTSAYVVSLPAYENVYAGIGTAGALAKQTLFRYDGATTYTMAPAQGLLTAKDRWNSQTGGYVTASFANDAYGNRTSETDEDGHATTHAYDASYHTFETQRCNALGQCTAYGWDTVLGVKTSETDPNGGTTLSTHDAIGRAVQIVSPGNSTVTYAYVSWGDPTGTITGTPSHIHKVVVDGSPDGLWSDEYSDGIGRVWRTVKKGGFTKDTLYQDASSRPWQESLWYVSGEAVRYDVYGYDGAGRPRTITHPDGTQAQRVYGNGTETELDELGHQHEFWKDGLKRVTQVGELNAGVWQYTTKQYDAQDDLVKVTDASGNTSSYGFDSLGRRVAVADVDMGASSYGYSAAGLLTSVADAAGRTTTFQYDAAGRRVTKIYPDGSEVTWAYDQAGHGVSVSRLTSVADANHSQSFTYGADGQTTSETQCVQGTCETFGRGYDVVGRLASVTYPDGEVITNNYDASGRLSAVSGYVTSIAYDSAGSITSMAYPNGTTTSFAYDPNRRWLTSSQVSATAGTLFQASYGYDAAARVTSTSSTTNALMNLSYAYDSLNRLTGVSGSQSENLAYDATGNVVSAGGGAYAYGDPNHVHAATAMGANTYTYDANGNMLSGGGRTLAWDYDNRLASVTTAAGTTSYQYNAGGGRILKSGPAGTTMYFGPLADTVDGTLEKYYFAGSIPVARQSAGTKTWLHADRLGSIRLMTDATGAKVNGYDYSPWGSVVAQSGTASNELGFEGHHDDAESGLVYMNARYYDPLLHRFLSADTVVPSAFDPQALNRYAFAYNNPVANTDPSGHAPVVVALVVMVAEDYTVAAIIAFVCTAVGYFEHNATLMTIGSVIDGCYTGGPVGGVVAAATSPISPISPKLKRDIGWAYLAYGTISNWASSNGTSGDASGDSAEQPGSQTAPDGTSADQTVPDTSANGAADNSCQAWNPSGKSEAEIWAHNAGKDNALGAEPGPCDGVPDTLGDNVAYNLKSEGGGFMRGLSQDSSFHVYGILHDCLIDNIQNLTGMDMSVGMTLGGIINVGSNAVLVGAGLHYGGWGKGTGFDFGE